ncbi:MAG: hypothetical protein AB7U63_03875 [Porticoccaceae bacterium]|jgi:hypothetical protein
MKSFGADSEGCPVTFNFDPDTFKVGDYVSYRVPGLFDDFPFVGIIVEVDQESIKLSANDPTNPDKVMKASRQSRPVVDPSEI